MRARVGLLLTVGSLLALPGLAGAQNPSQAQISAIRQSCRSDFQRQCSGVTPGGRDALECLASHRAQLSSACRAAVDAAVPPRKPAPPPAASAAPAAPAPAAAAGPASAWPHTITQDGATATIYQPQPTSWPGETTLHATAAVALQRPGTAAPVLGTVDISAATRADLARRLVTLSDIQVTATHFPSLDGEQAGEVDARIKQAASRLEAREVPLDNLLLALRDAPAETKPVETDNTPPVIFRSEYPARLVVFDGDPVLAPIAGSKLSLAVNTNWTLVQDTTTGRWYLLDGDSWLSAPSWSGPVPSPRRRPRPAPPSCRTARPRRTSAPTSPAARSRRARCPRSSSAPSPPKSS